MLPIDKIKDFGAAQESKFEPYAALGKGSGMLHKIIGTIGKDHLQTDSQIYRKVSKDCVIKLTYPEEARDTLNRLHPPENGVDIMDEAFIRKNEREKVIEKVRKHVDLNPQLFLGTVYRDDLQRFLLDTLKGGE